MRRSIEAALLLAILTTAPGLALAWSCASDEPLAAAATPEQRALVAQEVERARALAEAMACLEEGRRDCPEMPALVSVSTKAPAPVGQ